MKKFSRREIIILSIVCAVILFVVLDFALRKTPGEDSEGPLAGREHMLRETDALVGTMAATLKEGGSPGADAHILELAAKEWSRDPFFIGMTTPVERSQAASDLPPVSFFYTGYLEVGDRKMAIINGVDYKEGDAMDVPGYVLRSVSSQQVVIEHEQGRRRITVPFVEE